MQTIDLSQKEVNAIISYCRYAVNEFTKQISDLSGQNILNDQTTNYLREKITESKSIQSKFESLKISGMLNVSEN